MALNLPQVPFKLTSEDMGIPDFGKAIQSGLQNYKDYQEAKYAAQTAKSNADYKTAMANYLSNPYQIQRFMTPTGKLLNERSMLGENNSPEKDAYDRMTLKQTTDTDTRKKNLSVTNIDKTIDSINVKDLTRYGGVKGFLELKKEAAQASLNPGSESENYRSYLENANRAQLLSKQVRQFYGDSIQPAMLEKIEKLANPATWQNNPEIAERLFNSFTKLLKQETSTYREALKNTKPYQETAPNQEPSEDDFAETARHFGTTPEIVQSAMAAGVKGAREFEDWIKGLKQ